MTHVRKPVEVAVKNWQQVWVVLLGITLCGIALIPTTQFFGSRRQQVLSEVMMVDGLKRKYRLVMPAKPADPAAIGVVFALHGAWGSPAQMARSTDLDSLAAEHGVMVVYLEGRHQNWPPLIPPENPDFVVPDIRFFEMLCDHLVQAHAADPARFYLVGVSQGGSMVNLLASRCSDRLAAAVCHSGWLPSPLGETPLDTGNKCPMLFVIGSDDTQVSPEQVKEARDVFAAAGHPTEFHVLQGYAHGWSAESGVNQVVWDFLSQHSL